MTTNSDVKQCPYCAEDIRAEAIRCRYCRSRLVSGPSERAWHRDHDDARLAGVAAAIAHGFDAPISLVRLGFVVLTLFHFLGPVLYLGLWLVIPQRADGESLFESFADSVLRTAREMSARHDLAPSGSSGRRDDEWSESENAGERAVPAPKPRRPARRRKRGDGERPRSRS